MGERSDTYLTAKEHRGSRETIKKQELSASPAVSSAIERD